MDDPLDCIAEKPSPVITLLVTTFWPLDSQRHLCLFNRVQISWFLKENILCIFYIITPLNIHRMKKIGPKNQTSLFDSCLFQTIKILGVSCLTYKSNLVQREGRTDISDILWHLFSRQLKPILISKFTFANRSKEIMKNREKLLKN